MIVIIRSEIGMIVELRTIINKIVNKKEIDNHFHFQI